LAGSSSRERLTMAIDLAKEMSDSSRGEETFLVGVGQFDPPVPGRLVVVAPHPDDEVLGLGGFLSRCGRAGSVVEIVAVSDGEGAYALADLEARDQLAAVRARERESALSGLGLAAAKVHRLAIADGRVAESELALRDQLVEVLSRSATPTVTSESTVLVAPWRQDLHPDHEATGRAAVAAAMMLGCWLWEVPIWSWYHLGKLETPLPVGRAGKIPLSSTERTAKRRALDSFRSQSDPPAPHGRVLPEGFFSTFDRDFELVLVTR
jgi:LmbE family N-acetylglucosaminyl deacetylase